MATFCVNSNSLYFTLCRVLACLDWFRRLLWLFRGYCVGLTKPLQSGQQQWSNLLKANGKVTYTGYTVQSCMALYPQKMIDCFMKGCKRLSNILEALWMSGNLHLSAMHQSACEQVASKERIRIWAQLHSQDSSNTWMSGLDNKPWILLISSSLQSLCRLLQGDYTKKIILSSLFKTANLLAYTAQGGFKYRLHFFYSSYITVPRDQCGSSLQIIVLERMKDLLAVLLSVCHNLSKLSCKSHSFFWGAFQQLCSYVSNQRLFRVMRRTASMEGELILLSGSLCNQSIERRFGILQGKILHQFCGQGSSCSADMKQKTSPPAWFCLRWKPIRNSTA